MTDKTSTRPTQRHQDGWAGFSESDRLAERSADAAERQAAALERIAAALEEVVSSDPINGIGAIRVVG